MELGEALGPNALPALGSFDSAEDARANAVVITNSLNGTGLFDLRLDELIAEINRWFSLGSAQSTTLLDECARQHRDYKYNGAEKGAFVDLAEIFFYTGFLAYDEDNNIVDGVRMREVRAMAAALNGENSRAVDAATIESSLIGLFVHAFGVEPFRAAHGLHHRRVLLRRRHCRASCAARRSRSSASSSSPARRRRGRLALRDAVMGGNPVAVAAEVARFRQFYASIEERVLAAYPCCIGVKSFAIALLARSMAWGSTTPTCHRARFATVRSRRYVRSRALFDVMHAERSRGPEAAAELRGPGARPGGPGLHHVPPLEGSYMARRPGQQAARHPPRAD